MTTGERIKIRRKELGLSAERIADFLGVSPATIYRYEKGDIEKVPGDSLEPIAHILKTTPAFLMGWDEPETQLPENVLPMPKTYQVPLIGTIACGKPITAVEEAEDFIDVPDHVHADFALHCKGDSMINARIFDGDLVYIRQQAAVENGEIAAVLIEDEATLKRVYLYPDRVILEPANPTYDSIIYREEEMNKVRILGKAVAFTSIIKH